MKRPLFEAFFVGPAIAGAMAGIVGGSGADAVAAQDRCELPRQVVVGEPGNQVVFERLGANEEGTVLDELDWLTLLKWGAGVLLPALARDELAIHLHESDRAGFLSEYEDIGTFTGAGFFLACGEGRRYRVDRAIARRTEVENTVRSRAAPDRAGLHVGLTIPVDERQPHIVLRGHAAMDP